VPPVRSYQSKAKTCFQAHCNRKRCPSAPPLQHRADAPLRTPTPTPSKPSIIGAVACEKEAGRSGFKYDDEGSAAIMNAQLLALPGASLAVGAGPPARLEITVPVGDGGRHAHMYFCFRCEQSRDLTPTSNLTAGCLFAAHQYEAPHLRDAVSRGHACRYFEPGTMRALCAAFSRTGDLPDHRGKTYAEQCMRPLAAQRMRKPSHAQPSCDCTRPSTVRRASRFPVVVPWVAGGVIRVWTNPHQKHTTRGSRDHGLQS
jgi:hypothetical protein